MANFLRWVSSFDGTALAAGLRWSETKVAEAAPKIGAAFSSGIKSRLGAAFGAAAIVATTEQIVRSGIAQASAWKDAAEQLDTTTDEVQKIDKAMSKAGLSTEDYATGLKALAQLRREAAQGDEKSRKQLEEYGMTLADVRDESMSTVEFAKKLQDALSKVQLTPTQRTGLKDLLGRNAERMIGAVASIKNETADVSPESIEAADRFDKKIKQGVTFLKALTVNSLFPSIDEKMANLAKRQAEGLELKRPGEKPLGPIIDSVNGNSDPLFLKNEAELAKTLNELYEKGVDLQYEKMGALGKVKQLNQEIAALEIAAANYDPSNDREKEERQAIERRIAIKRGELTNELMKVERPGLEYVQSARHAAGAFSGPNQLVQVGRSQLKVLQDILQKISAPTSSRGLAIRVPS